MATAAWLAFLVFVAQYVAIPMTGIQPNFWGACFVWFLIFSGLMGVIWFSDEVKSKKSISIFLILFALVLVFPLVDQWEKQHLEPVKLLPPQKTEEKPKKKEFNPSDITFYFNKMVADDGSEIAMTDSNGYVFSYTNLGEPIKAKISLKIDGLDYDADREAGGVHHLIKNDNIGVIYTQSFKVNRATGTISVVSIDNKIIIHRKFYIRHIQ